MPEKEKKENFGHKVLRTTSISLGIWTISVCNAIYVNNFIDLEYLMMTLFAMCLIGIGLYGK